MYLLSTNFAGGHLIEPVLRGGYMRREGVLLSWDILGEKGEVLVRGLNCSL